MWNLIVLKNLNDAKRRGDYTAYLYWKGMFE